MASSVEPLEIQCHAFFLRCRARAAEKWPTVKPVFGIESTGPGNKMEKQLNVSVDFESVPPMLEFRARVNTTVAFTHRNFYHARARIFKVNDGRRRSFRDLDRQRHRQFARLAILVTREQLTFGVTPSVGIRRRQLETNQALELRPDPF